jgi:hypothetical protein
MLILMMVIICFFLVFDRVGYAEENNYKENVMNFIRFREMNKNKKIQEYKMGEFYLTDINMKSQLQIIIDVDYLEKWAIEVNDKRIKIESSYELDRKISEELKVSEIVFKGERIGSNDPVVYYIEESGLQDDDKLKIKVSFEKKENEGWKVLSANEMKFRIRRAGLKMHSSDTLAFVRDSFSKNWKPQPGTSVTFGFTFYMTKKTPGIARFIGRTWNLLDPRFGVNVTLLDFDEDKNLEIGLGPVFSVMKGAFYIGVGWNFTTSRNKNQYAFFGMSIKEVAKKLKGIISK